MYQTTIEYIVCIQEIFEHFPEIVKSVKQVEKTDLEKFLLYLLFCCTIFFYFLLLSLVKCSENSPKFSF